MFLLGVWVFRLVSIKEQSIISLQEQIEAWDLRSRIVQIWHMAVSQKRVPPKNLYS